MPVAKATSINDAMRRWSQGDVVLQPNIDFVHLADHQQAHSLPSSQLQQSTTGDVATSLVAVLSRVVGIVALSQTCDLQRDWRDRPFAEVAPLVKVTSEELAAIQRLKRPAFAYLPAVADRGLVVDLDRIMTVEKAVLTTWRPLPGVTGDNERRDFGRALARKWARMAFPDDFIAAAQQIRKRFLEKHHRQSEEGAHLRALREIRVSAAPSWNDPVVAVTWWFIREAEPRDFAANWAIWTERWMDRFDSSGRFRTDACFVAELDDLTAREYVESDKLDLDQLSVERDARSRPHSNVGTA